MKEHVKQHYNMRVTLSLNDPESPTEQRKCIKEWMQVVHMIDNTFLVYKFKGRDEDKPIASLDQLPMEEDDLDPWFVDHRVYQNIFFSQFGRQEPQPMGIFVANCSSRIVLVEITFNLTQSRQNEWCLYGGLGTTMWICTIYMSLEVNWSNS